MISWITMAILSGVRRSTSGRAPWFRAIIRFWIRVDSLNRPPTLLTISSSFNSSSIDGSTSTAVLLHQGNQDAHRKVQVVFEHLDRIMDAGNLHLAPGIFEATEDGGLVVGPACPQAGL